MTEADGLECFRQFLDTVAKSTNETSTREAFVTLAAKGFDDSQLSRDLALGAEYQVRFRRQGLIRRGAIDSFFGNLIIEFEHDLRKTGDHACKQLQGYCAGAWSEDSSANRPYLAIASDGATWRVYTPQLRDPNGPIDESNIALLPLEEWSSSNSESDASELKGFLNRLFYRQSLIAPTSSNFVRDFGLTSSAYRKANKVFAAKLNELNAHPRLEVLEAAWDASLQAAYGQVETTRELLAQHTYLALLARLLVWAALERRPLQANELDDVLGGIYFESRMIANMVESDFFRWHELDSATKVDSLFVALANQIAGYDLTAIKEDVLKPLYENLVDPGTRHALGEFYTPDWLADRVARRLVAPENWEKAPRVLDPACGSGTFLRAAIQVVREERPCTTLAEILSSVMGVDVHPLAVTVARATYLLAIQDLVEQATEPVTLPVFLSNALTMPAVHRQHDLFGNESFSLRVDDRDYEVPSELILRGSLYDAAIEDMMSVARSYGHPDTNIQDAEKSLAAVLGNRLQEVDPSGKVVSVLGQMAVHIAQLIRVDRDSVHGFLLKNHYRPAMLRSTFDYVIGNPPWLTVGDVQLEEYHNAIVQRAVDTRIAPRAVGEQSHTEIATLFIAAAFQDYLDYRRPSGDTPRVGFVMPRSLMTAKHHRFVREGKYDHKKVNCDFVELWDLDQVLPLFNIPACVLFAAMRPPRSDQAKRGLELSGRLPKKDADVDLARERVTERIVEIRLSFLGKRSAWKAYEPGAPDDGGSVAETTETHYASAFRQGAIIYPQTALVVVGNATREKRQVRVRTDPRVVESARKPTDRVNHVVDSSSLFSTLAADNLVPFSVFGEPRCVILPVLGDPGTGSFATADPDTLRAHGLVKTADWLVWAETQWEAVRKDTDTGRLFERLDYLGHLSAQGCREEHIVLYTAAGKRPVATTLTSADLPLPFVARDRTYHASFSSASEAHYLCAYLNSDFLSGQIEAWINRGLFGPRDINKRALDVPWPQYDQSSAKHVELAELAKSLRTQAREKLSAAPDYSIGRLRTWLRGQLDEQKLLDLEVLVKDISASSY